MLNLRSTERPKRIARDLKAVLDAGGHTIPYSRCLELASRMLGHAGYGMLARSAGHAPAGPDDDALTPVEAAERRAFQARVLLQAGVPEALVGPALDVARPTSRSKPRADTANPVGCAWFDDVDGYDPGGWACLAGGVPVRFRSMAALDPSATWWTNLRYEAHRKLGLRGSRFLPDRYLPVSPLGALDENGIDPADARGSSKAAATLFASVAALVEGFSPGLPGDSRSLIEGLGKLWAPCPCESPLPGPIPRPWEEFVATPVRSHRGAQYRTFRRPRVEHARTMLGTPVPTGPWETVDLRGMADSENRSWLDGREDVAFVAVDPDGAPQPVSPLRMPLLHPSANPRWFPRPVFEAAFAGTDASPVAALVAHEWMPGTRLVHQDASSFLAVADGNRWADGIVAEALWRSGLSRSTEEPEGWQGGLGAAYLRGVDIAAMCAEAEELSAGGAAVTSYGLGWVRFTMQPEAPLWFPEGLRGTGVVASWRRTPSLP